MDQVVERKVTSQRQEFACQVLPDLFHAAPDQFLFYLERDGIKVIHFYWNEIAKKLPRSAVQPALGLSFEIRRPRPRVTVVLISMPLPHNPGEVYYTGLCHRPYRVMPFGWLSDTSKVLNLEWLPSGDQPDGTLLVEWSKRHGREVIGRGPVADLDYFYQAVLEEIKD
jgi:hypothetical protein